MANLSKLMDTKLSLFNLEVWEEHVLKPDTAETELALLRKLVERVRSLQNVEISSTSYVTDDDELVIIPGPWTVNAAPGNSDRFVAKNEFGHARIQQYMMPKSAPRKHPRQLNDDESKVFEAGGHCVLPKELFQECVTKKWGMPHPLAGHYHPILGNHIPETTMLFRAPRNDDELEVIWGIVQASYMWVTSNDSDE